MPFADLIPKLCDAAEVGHFVDLFELIESAPPLPLTQLPACGKTSSNVQRAISQYNLDGSSLAAGLWLLARDWHRSHTISQELHDPEGSYWHGILHRIEGDYWNSKYWLRKSGGAAIGQQLVNQIRDCTGQLIQSENPASSGQIPDQLKLNQPDSVSLELVNLVEKVVTQKKAVDRQAAEMVCWWEWQLLFFHCLCQHKHLQQR